MDRWHAGETISKAVTVSGSGSLSAETFAATVTDQIGFPMSASASITDAAAREVTITVAASEWTFGAGGYGRMALTMTAGGVKTIEHDERFKVDPGIAVPQTATGYV